MSLIKNEDSIDYFYNDEVDWIGPKEDLRNLHSSTVKKGDPI